MLRRVVVVLLLMAGSAHAQVICADVGPAPDRVDLTLAPRIIAWATKVEAQLGLSAAAWRGVPAHALSPVKDAAITLQAVTAHWVDEAEPGTVEETYREAVGHGVNTQVETVMVTADPGQADNHRYFATL